MTPSVTMMPRSPSWCRIPIRDAVSASCYWSTSPRPDGSGGSAGAPQIFREMGYETSGSIESGVQQVQLNLDPTETSINVMQGREHRAEAASIRQLFHARSVAVVGASRRADSVGQILVRNLVLGNYAG